MTEFWIDMGIDFALVALGFFFGLVYAARQQRLGRKIGDPR